ncbi:hypothetical protein FHS95_002401 [Sphingomonas naasensis]|uniref:Uncharacterized protein n=1 Tax=Sphingomonas naasensis TaxID=1344951 RepID=A0A4S1W8M0_9SPHN|nr:hypothetical protein [Sphingomonas naasensis]NIJ20709.1 hypothetical protein [Sphingomonas naasensis]TGX37570.1 hypothetical protein E5A74_19675 [Sphingomonas naasensis]
MAVIGFVARWLFALTLAFIAFPIMVTIGARLWQGPGENFDLVGGILVIGVLQFFPPLNLWMIPFLLGTVGACIWHARAQRSAADHEDPQA